MRTQQQTAEPLGLPAGGGEYLQWADKGHEFWIKVSGEQSGGALCVVEAAAAAGAKVGLHVHDRDEEWYWVLAGTYRFTLGDQDVRAEAGAFVFIPRGTPHGWALESDGGRVLLGFAPAGAELIFREIAAAKDGGGDTPEDWARLGELTHTRWLG
jgi:quercetin dioxygenase-like cupin family protein